MAVPLLELRDIAKNFSGVKALDGVSLRIAPGEIHCLAGENGSGKSTLIKVVSGVNTVDAGTILIDGEMVSGMTPRQAIAFGVQVIYQDFSLFGNLTVAENLSIGAELRERRRVVSWRRIARACRGGRCASSACISTSMPRSTRCRHPGGSSWRSPAR